MYLHVFIGSNTTRLTQNLQQALCRVRSYFDGDTQEALPLFEGLLAYLRLAAASFFGARRR